ncbi:carboxypeptidase regulatory-like domain-containing protein [Paludisphaera sp.]|uniref:carboxypeptidase regulatory-like domain-containing protein n=1 Tax=Paludisphaera sp. TaxID=2017432 RepID=UPI00301B93A2
MRIPPSILGLLAVVPGLCVVGCSQTGGLRAVAPSDVKTTASVGDRSLPVVAGLPGEEARVADPAPGSRRAAGARISGRVYDEEGEPVRNAVVRLAMSGAAGGKLLHAVTDRSGAFTLRGVRPGSTYTVIAEYQGEQGMMTGRAEAEAPDVDLSIALHPRDAQPGQGGAVAAAPKRPRVRPVAQGDDLAFDPYEDEEPRARSRSARPIRPRLDARPEAFDAEPEGFDVEPTAPPSDAYDDDGENPLPPAREISQVSARVEGPSPDDEADAPRDLPANLIDDGREPAGPSPAAPARQERARPRWTDVAARADVVPLDEQVAQTNAVRQEAAPPAEPTPAVEPPPVAEPPPAAEPAPEQLAATEPAPATESEPESMPAPAPAATPAPTTAAARPASRPADLEARRKAPYCEYDADQRQVTSLAMLDINGKKVSLRDFDADLILLDFWGSWCAQCRPALDHMKALQSRLGGKKLQVVSIAYEKTPKETRAEKLAEVATAMGLNFPVLMTDFSDPCPVREALAVDVFPTMILLDREGRVLRRERGATPVTLGNIDRAIADHFERLNGPQYARREARGRATR